jgi:hypothetical protein
MFASDPTRPVSLPGYLADLERRVAEVERGSPLAGYRQLFRIQVGKRFYFDTTNRWVNWAYTSYGVDHIQANNARGTGSEPVQEWEDTGMLFRPGDRITAVRFTGRTNSAEVTDMELSVVFNEPANLATGLDADGELASTELLRVASWVGHASYSSASLQDIHSFDHALSYDVPGTGWLSIDLKPVGTITANYRYLYSQVEVEWSRAAV